MSSDITLSSAQRQTLLSLKNISNLSDRTQVRLATGRKINSVTDGAEDFFASRTLQKRAGILQGRREQIDQGISTIQAALDGIDALDELLSQLRGLSRQARSQTAEERAETTNSYNSVVTQFAHLLDDTSYQGLNLLDDNQNSLSVKFSEQEESLLTIDGVNIAALTASEGGIFAISSGAGRVALSALRNITTGFTTGGLSQGFSVLSASTQIQDVLNSLDQRISDAQERLETRAGVLGNNVAILRTRLDYTDSVIAGHISGSDKIVNADLNEEAANLTATGTQYQIGVQSLGVSGQRVQSLLQLIR